MRKIKKKKGFIISQGKSDQYLKLSIKYNYRKEKDMERENRENKKGFSNTGFTMIHKDFIKNWTKIIGTGPTMLYFQLLSYCYGIKNMPGHLWVP